MPLFLWGRSMMAEPLRRPFKVFESADADEVLAMLAGLFGEQTARIHRLGSTPDLTSVSVGNVATSVLCHLRSPHELHFTRDGTRDLINVNLLNNGRLQVAFGAAAALSAADVDGYVLPQDRPFRAMLRQYDGLSFLIPRATIREVFERITGRTATVPIEFEPVFEARCGSGALLRGAVEMVAAQLAEAWSPLAHPAVAARLEEFIIHALLQGLPHNYRDVIAGERWTASPKQVRRAEAYIRAHAEEPLRLAQIAGAAGCSIRALQLAFRTFRDTTPMATLRQLRLDGVHAALAQSEPEATTVTAVAARFGFYNAHRFVQDYRKSFGQLPSETLRFGSTMRRAPSAADRPVATAMHRGDR